MNEMNSMIRRLGWEMNWSGAGTCIGSYVAISVIKWD